jgi:hypothetical protein
MAYVKKSKEEMILLGLQRATIENLKTKKRGNVFKVTNHEGDTVYTVNTSENSITSCDCPQHTHRHIACKHMFAVLLQSRNKYTI